MAELTLEVDVEAPAATTWAAATDWARQGAWMVGTRVWPTSQDGRGVGATIAAKTGLGPLGVLDTMTITRWDPPRLCATEHTGRVVRGSGRFEVLPLSSTRSRFVWQETLDLPLGPAGRAGWIAVRPLFRSGVALSLRRFARWAPGHAPAPEQAS